MPHAVLAIVPRALASAMADAARTAGVDLRVEHTAAAGFAALQAGPYLATIVSLSTEWMDLETLSRIASDPGSGAVLATAADLSLERTVGTRRAGALRLLAEPPDPDELCTELMGLTASYARAAVAVPGLDSDAPALLGSSSAMTDVFAFVARVSETDVTVLITGESGTGKELVARAVHWASPRATAPFVAVNCAAIPEHLLESELFGHERGAFTGAVATKIGRFERAGGGTLFLDEIGDMSLVLQAKILRAIQEREIERLGGDAVLDIDVRVVAATNRDLQARIAEGAFREDLFFRLAVVEVALPPLRDRGDDIEMLALHFAAEFAARYERGVEGLSREAITRLRAHSWPGNVRELRNVMDRAVLLARGPSVGPEDLHLGERAPRGSPRGDDASAGYDPTVPLEEVEAHHIRRVLAYTEGRMAEAARLLGIHRNTLTRKVKQYGLGVDA